MTTTILVAEALIGCGIDADWVATGQTGCIIHGEGAVIDSVVIDFVPGTIERLLGATTAAVVIVEGQGGILHPAYSPSTVALMHACRPQHHVLCHRLGARVHAGTDVEIADLATVAARTRPRSRRSASNPVCSASRSIPGRSTRATTSASATRSPPGSASRAAIRSASRSRRWWSRSSRDSRSPEDRPGSSGCVGLALEHQ